MAYVWATGETYSTNTSNAGQVKVNYTGLSLTGFTSGVVRRYAIESATPTVSPAPTTRWPNPSTGNYLTEFFIPGATPATTSRLRENNVPGQATRWRITGTYTGKGSTNNGQIELRLRNPASGFQITAENTLPTGLTAGNFTMEMSTIADNASLCVTCGYVLEATTSFTDTNINFNITSITRFSDAM
jgi:hypothetical protein